jgi:DNA-binding response OmpR family regulator
MSLKSLLLCSDEKIIRVLRRVLIDLEIAMEHCARAEDAVHKLTRERFEAVIVDCDDMPSASVVLKSVRTAPCNKRAIAVGLIDGHTGLRIPFEMGAHFVLYKPISSERARTSFRAARALMKRERRRNLRVPIQIPVTFPNTGQRPTTIDLGEGGLAVKASRKMIKSGPLQLSFTLPGSDAPIEVSGQVAWESPNGQTGIRFVDVPPEISRQLKTWLNDNAPESEKDDPPVRCRLTDLSLGGCYLEMNAPFPVRTRVVLSMRVADLEVQAEGVVRVMHPEMGMGVEFTQRTTQQREHVEKFIQMLMNSKGVLPNLMVAPEGLEPEVVQAASALESAEELDDPLLELFHRRSELPADAFLGELRKQRRSQNSDPAETVLEL